jgi:hypothetical protein
MPIIRAAERKSYSRLSNTIVNDARISLAAKGLWLFLLSKPDTWFITINGVASQIKERHTTIKRLLKELERYGYVERRKTSKGKGQIETITTIFEEPFSSGRFSSDENTSGENMGGIGITDEVNNKKVNKKELPLTRTRSPENPATDRQRGTRFNDPRYEYELRSPYDVRYIETVIQRIFGGQHGLSGDDIECVRRAVQNFGKQEVVQSFREAREVGVSLDVAIEHIWVMAEVESEGGNAV